MTESKAKMRIVLISHEFAPAVGGVASFVKTILAELGRREFVSLVLTRTMKERAVGACDQSVGATTSVVRLLPQSWRRPQALVEIVRSLAFIRRLEKRKDDLVFCDAGAILVALAFLIVFRRAPRGRVILHGTEVLRFACGHFRGVRYLVHRLLLDRHLDVIAISQAVATEIDKHFPGVGPRVVHNGADFSEKMALSSVPPSSLNGLSPLRVLVVGRLDYRKRIDLIIKAGRLIKQRPICLHIVGDGVTRASLEALVETHKSENLKVIFHGRISEAALNKEYRLADLIFIPAGRRNLSMEGFGLTVLEGLSNGVVPVAFDLDGPGEIARCIGCPVVKAEVKSIAAFLSDVDMRKLYSGLPKMQKNLLNFSVCRQVDTLFGYDNCKPNVEQQ